MAGLGDWYQKRTKAALNQGSRYAANPRCDAPLWHKHRSRQCRARDSAGTDGWRHRTLRRRQIDPAAYDQPPHRSQRRIYFFRQHGSLGPEGPGAAPLAARLRDDLPTVQSGAAPRRADQCAAGSPEPSFDRWPTCSAFSPGRNAPWPLRRWSDLASRRRRFSPPVRCPVDSSSVSRSPAP